MAEDDPISGLLKLEDGEFLIEPAAPDEQQIAVKLGQAVYVDPHENRRVFHRVGIKFPGGRRVRWLVVEHGQTRIYFTEKGIIVTDKELNP